MTMMVLYFLIIVFAILLWFLLAFGFVPVGRILYRLWHEAMTEMKRNGDEEKVDEKKEEDDL